ncbi:shikimate kinase [Lentibacillus saliphilus]|uniref:shikimate kinase n=1 Tax=Lentibacillus saliphilus TaxID=2737028 RepID=UPI001C305D90|nr:shikimate kinase [Lentibacillus saliphilus]
MGHIYLIGFMGSGKTTVAKELGRLLERPVLDTDQLIEAQHGPIKDIFKREGERVFRAYESKVLRGIKVKQAIVATGGGIVENQENVDYMHYNGFTIYLQASFREVSKRLKNDEARPLWTADQHAQNLYDHRFKMYERSAHEHIRTDHKTPLEIAAIIARLIELRE